MNAISEIDTAAKQAFALNISDRDAEPEIVHPADVLPIQDAAQMNEF